MERIVKIIIDDGKVVDVVNLPDTYAYEVSYKKKQYKDGDRSNMLCPLCSKIIEHTFKNDIHTWDCPQCSFMGMDKD